MILSVSTVQILTILGMPLFIVGAWISVNRTEKRFWWLIMFFIGSVLYLLAAILMHNFGMILMEAYFAFINGFGLIKLLMIYTKNIPWKT